jgi:proteasome accessory factor B
MGMPVVERLVNLVIALLETRRPLTFEELRRRTGFYPQADLASARRMFERDKDALRSLGVPIETRQDFGMDDPGYIIDRQRYELRDIDLTSEEVAALALAVDMIGSAEGALPLAKVAARAPEPTPMASPPTRIGLEVTAIDPVADAIVERRVLRFPYRTADGRDGLRTLEPYGIVRRRRAWYVVGRDRDRGVPRGFRLDRITGPIESLEPANAFEPDTELDLGAVVTGPEPQLIDAHMAVTAAGRWTVEARGGRAPAHDPAADADAPEEGGGEDDLLQRIVQGIDVVRDRAWLLAIAPEAAVLAPPALQEDLASALTRTLALHADAESVR